MSGYCDPRLDALAALPDGWGPDRSIPIRTHLLEQADRVIRAAGTPQHIAPVDGGALQLEYWRGRSELEVYFFRDGISYLHCIDRDDESTWLGTEIVPEDEAIRVIQAF